MKAGVLGTFDEEFSRLEPYRGSRSVDDHNLTDQIDVTGVARTASGVDITEGVAAREEVATVETTAIEFDAISLDSKSDVVVKHTDFAVIPGELVVVENSKGLFLYDILERSIGVSSEQVNVSLDGVRSEFPDASLWKVGFYGREEGAENGVLHGKELQDDPAVAEHLTSGSLNQLGMRVTIDSEEYNLFITESGYVELYEPRELGTKEFLLFVRTHLQPHFS